MKAARRRPAARTAPLRRRRCAVLDDAAFRAPARLAVAEEAGGRLRENEGC